MKKLIALSLAIIMICSTFVGCSLFEKDKDTSSYSKGLEFRYISHEDSYILTGIGTCKDKHIVIPKTYKGKPVTQIDLKALNNCTQIESIVIGKSVEYIANCAFIGCTSLKSVTISSSVTRIGHDIFHGCTSLEKVIFKDPSNWGQGKMIYFPEDDNYRWTLIPIEEDLSNPEIAAQLLTSTYISGIQKIE